MISAAVRTVLFGAPPFSPRSLFASGAQGAWYDPSNLGSMYQDSAGTTPVTAVGQPVGLRLDMRLGLTRGADVVINGGFDADANWTKGGGWSIAGGKAIRVADAGFSNLSQLAVLTLGTTYEITFDVDAIGGAGGLYVFCGTGIQSALITTTGPKRVILACTGNTSLILQASNAGTTCTVDNVVCRPLPGNHATQSTSTSRPTLQQDSAGRYYLSYDGVDDGMATGSIDFTGTAQMTVFAGVTKNSDAAAGVILELGNGVSAATTKFTLTASSTAAANFKTDLFNTTDSQSNSRIGTTYTAPISCILTTSYDYAQASIAAQNQIRVNGQTPGGLTATGSILSASNFGNLVLNQGRRNGTSLPFNGRDYGIVLLGRTATATEIARTERWLASRMGVTL